MLLLPTFVHSHGQNLTKPNIQGPIPGIEVNSYNGNLVVVRNDLYIPALGPDINVTFTYNSSKTLLDYGFGSGWTFSGNILYEAQGTDIIIRRADGRKDVFSFDGVEFIPPQGIFDELTEYTPGQYKLVSKNGSESYFDNPISKRVTRIQDRYGNGLDFDYLEQELQSITDAAGRSIDFEWTSGRMTMITDNIATPTREIQYSYDANGMPVAVADPLGGTTSYGYDSERKLTSLTNKNGTEVSVSYDANRAVTTISSILTNQVITWDEANLITQVTEQVNGGTRITSYHYNNSGEVIQIENPCCDTGLNVQYIYDSDRNVTERTDGNGNTFLSIYDSAGNRISETNPLGEVTTWTYDPIFNQTSSLTDRNGNVYSYTYDGAGNLTTVGYPDGGSETYTFDASGNVASFTDGNGNVTNYVYDSNGYRTEVHMPIGVEITSFDNVGNVSSITDPNGNSTTYQYDALNRLVSMIDPLGNSSNYSYDPVGNQTSITSPLGHTKSFVFDPLNRITQQINEDGTAVSYSYDELGNVLEIQDENGNISSYQYNSQNLLELETNALGNSRTFSYDANGNLSSETDFNGNTTSYIYDAVDRLVEVQAPLSQTHLYTYDANGNEITETDANGNTTQRVYNVLNRLVQINYPIGSEVLAYDNNGNLITHTDPVGGITAYSYDSMNRLITETNPLGNSTIHSYDTKGNRIGLTNAIGAVHAYTYDARDLQTSYTNGLGETILLSFDAEGKLDEETWPNGNVVSYSYDTRGRLLSTFDLLGPLDIFGYDNVGNKVFETNALGQTWSFSYDPLHRSVSVTDPQGNSSLFQYDNNGNLTQSTDRNGNISVHLYDALNRQIQSVDPMGFQINATYDPQGNLTSFMDENGHPTTYAYDAMNRAVSLTLADGTSTNFTYDANGNVVSRLDNNGSTTSYTYNLAQQLIYRDYPGLNDDTFAYDAIGRMNSAQNLHATVSLAYDLENRLIEEVLNGQTTDISHDTPGMTRTVTYPGGRVIVEHYDSRQQLTEVSEGGAALINYAYDSEGNVAFATRANGVTTTRTYNSNSWLTELKHINGVDTIAHYDYSFDNEGSLLTKAKSHHPAGSEVYQYDSNYRLVGFDRGEFIGGSIPTPLRSDQFAYDGVHNRTSTIENGVGYAYTSNNLNQYLSVTGPVEDPKAYDANGNLISNLDHSFTWNTENKLISVDSGASATYEYDPLGRRISKTVPCGGCGDETTYYFYNYNHVIEEQDGLNVVLATYAYGDLTDEVVAMDRDGSRYYYLQNEQGSVISLTNELGLMIERYEYDPFGTFETFDAGYSQIIPTVENPYFYTGRRLDEESALYYFRARQYDPSTGVFVTRDPSEYIDGMNLYSGYFAMHLGRDPLGLKEAKKPTVSKPSTITTGSKYYTRGRIDNKGKRYEYVMQKLTVSVDVKNCKETKNPEESICRCTGKASVSVSVDNYIADRAMTALVVFIPKSGIYDDRGKTKFFKARDVTDASGRHFISEAKDIFKMKCDRDELKEDLFYTHFLGSGRTVNASAHTEIIKLNIRIADCGKKLASTFYLDYLDRKEVDKNQSFRFLDEISGPKDPKRAKPTKDGFETKLNK